LDLNFWISTAEIGQCGNAKKKPEWLLVTNTPETFRGMSRSSKLEWLPDKLLASYLNDKTSMQKQIKISPVNWEIISLTIRTVTSAIVIVEGIVASTTATATAVTLHSNYYP